MPSRATTTAPTIRNRMASTSDFQVFIHFSAGQIDLALRTSELTWSCIAQSGFLWILLGSAVHCGAPFRWWVFTAGRGHRLLVFRPCALRLATGRSIRGPLAMASLTGTRLRRRLQNELRQSLPVQHRPKRQTGYAWQNRDRAKTISPRSLSRIESDAWPSPSLQAG